MNAYSQNRMLSHEWKRVVARRGVDGMAGVPLYFQSLELGIAKGLGGRAGKEGTNCKLSEGQAQGAMDVPCHIKDCE